MDVRLIHSYLDVISFSVKCSAPSFRRIEAIGIVLDIAFASADAFQCARRAQNMIRKDSILEIPFCTFGRKKQTHFVAYVGS